MKKSNVVISIILGVLIITLSFILFNVSRETYDVENIYSDLLYVLNVNYETNVVTFETNTGELYLYECDFEIEDIYVGDFYNVIFYNNKTPDTIYDDEIINFKYERPDLFGIDKLFYDQKNNLLNF